MKLSDLTSKNAEEEIRERIEAKAEAEGEDGMVPAWARTDGDFKGVTQARDIVVTVVQLSKNERIIPKKMEKLLANSFFDHARQVYYMVSEANEYRLDIPEEYKLRRGLQKKAKIMLTALVCDINVIREVSKAPLEKFAHLCKLIDMEVRTVSGWMRSDDARIKAHAEEAKKDGEVQA